MSTRIRIQRHRGDTTPIEVTITDSAGAAVPITGYAFTLSVSATSSAPETADYLFQSTGSITDAIAGTVEFPISAADADNVGSYWYDVEMVDASAKVKTIADGVFQLDQDVTK